MVGVHLRWPDPGDRRGQRARCRAIAWSGAPAENGPGRSPPIAARSSAWIARPAAATSWCSPTISRAQVWDLKDRTCRGLPGSWTSAVFLDDDTLVLTAAADAPRARRARLVRARRDRGSQPVRPRPRPSSRDRSARSRSPSTSPSRALTLSPDGTRIAARANPHSSPLVCVWDDEDGRLTHWISPPRRSGRRA